MSDVLNELSGWGYIIVTFVVGLLGFNIRRTAMKVDTHDREHVGRTELTNTVKSIRSEMQSGREEIGQRIEGLTQAVITLANKK